MRAVAVLLCATLGASACVKVGIDGAVTPPLSSVDAVSLTLSSDEPMTSAGDIRTAVAVVLDANQVPVSPSPTVSWSTSAPTVATVTGAGPVATITGVADGTAIITATNGSARGTITVIVRRRLASIALSAPSELPLGLLGQVSAVGLDARNNEIAGLTGITYSSDNPGTMIVAPNGRIEALFQFPQTPTATITATATKDGATATASKTITVVPPRKFDYAALMLSDFEKPTRVPTLGAGIAYFLDEVLPTTPTSTKFLHFLITWSTLSGPATGVSIRGPATSEEVSDVLTDFPLTTQTANHGTVVGVIEATQIRSQGGGPPISMDSLRTLLGSRNAYVEVRTAVHPNGEIRGQAIANF